MPNQNTTTDETLRALLGESEETVARALVLYYTQQRDEALSELEQAAGMLRDAIVTDKDYDRLQQAHARVQRAGDALMRHEGVARGNDAYDYAKHPRTTTED